ncbi:MAG: glycosidase [Thermoprotei archaeon]|nr:MAG: glycosidase [Thermoprotei archaeon]
MKIAFIGSWGTDGGVSRHLTPIVEWLRSQKYEVKVFTHYKEAPHGMPLNIEDEDYVVRCYTTQGRKIKELKAFNSEPILRALKEGYNVFIIEDLGMLPMEDLLEIFPRVKAGAKVLLVNHDNKPKPNDSLFWKFEWDAIINFLPGQNEFMTKHYSRDKIHLTDFPCYPIVKIDKDIARQSLNLPKDKKIIITFGEYDFISPFRALYELREKDPSIYLLCLTYTEKQKKDLEGKLKELGYEKGYDEIRAEGASSWKRRAEYVAASDVVVLDKGENITGEGAVLSSTAHQIMGWGTPIIARANKFFEPLNMVVVTYRNNAELKRKIRELLYNNRLRENIIRRARAFALAHSPERVTTQILEIINDLTRPTYPPCGKVKRLRTTPLIRPRREAVIAINGELVRWERCVYNAAAIRLEGVTYVLYRALGYDGISRIGLWWSRDGIREDGRLDYPIFGPETSYELPRDISARREYHIRKYGIIREAGGTEDPRVVEIDGYIYMTYTAYGDIVQAGLAKVKKEDFLRAVEEFRSFDEWKTIWRREGLIFPGIEDKDVILYPQKFGDKYCVVHRIPPDMQIVFTDNPVKEDYETIGRTFARPRPWLWDNLKIGAGAPPLKTKYGWLHIYHGVGEVKGVRKYMLGVIVTDLKMPDRIIYRSPNPILVPEKDYEVHGWAPNVVFCCGAVPKHKDSNEVLEEDDEILIYYGGADHVIGVGEARISELIPRKIRENI